VLVRKEDAVLLLLTLLSCFQEKVMPFCLKGCIDSGFCPTALFLNIYCNSSVICKLVPVLHKKCKGAVVFEILFSIVDVRMGSP